MTTTQTPNVAGSSAESNPAVQPYTEHNQKLLANVHPTDWVNPDPPAKGGRYNMVVIGAGTAGLVTAAGAVGMGAKVALIERGLMGGDCLNVGCVPSKALLRSAKAYADVRDASRFGVKVPSGVSVEFATVMDRMRKLRAGISPHDSVKRFSDLGIDVYLGQAKFTGPDSVEVGGKTLRFARACIATGARATGLPIPGLKEVGPLTNETIFSLTELPKRLAVIGGGPIGVEMAQAFARFGSQVTVLENMPKILGREDGDASALVRSALERDGVNVTVNCKIQEVTRRDGDKTISYEVDGTRGELVVDEVLVSVGRAPNVDGLGLEEARVSYDKRIGVEVNDYLQTSNRNIYAAGDICFPYKFTHSADALARIVIRNALFFGRARASALTIPWCTYSDPELAHVGITEDDANKRGDAVQTFRVDLSSVDRSILDGEDEGFLKVHADRKGRILGATMVARHAGDMICELSLAMTAGIGLGKLSETVHPYPTHAEVIKKAADAYNRTRLTPRVQRLFERVMRWRR